MAAFSNCLLAIFSVIVGLFFLTKLFKRRRGLPPGPTPLPLIGNVLQIGRKPHIRFTEWSRKYGPIFMIKMGTMDAVVINDHKLMKELFSDNACTGRIVDNAVVHEFSRGAKGILFSEGSTWEQQRRFTMHTLKNLGFGKTSLEGIILDEVSAILDLFKENGVKPISGTQLFNAPVLNTLWRIATGERVEWEEYRPPMMDIAEEFFNSLLAITTNGVFFAPVLRFIAPEYLGWNRYVKGINNMILLFDKSIQQHKDFFDPNDLRDYIDHFLLETEMAQDSTSSFYGRAGYDNLIAGLFDLFMAGSVTTANTLSWTLLYLIQNQDIQENIQTEIDKNLGRRSPVLSDRPSMPYTEAVILEILRITSILPLGAPHRMVQDKMFHGFFLPKGTSIFGNIYGIHHDPEIWGDPKTFIPERFLNEDKTKVVRHEALVPFSDGKRKCLGDTVAKDTLFLFVVSIFQKFNVLPDIYEDGNPKELDFEPELGMLLVPKPYKFLLLAREE